MSGVVASKLRQNKVSTRGIDKAPRSSIGNVIWVLLFDTVCQLSHLFSNSEPAMLSKEEVALVELLPSYYSRATRFGLGLEWKGNNSGITAVSLDF